MAEKLIAEKWCVQGLSPAFLRHFSAINLSANLRFTNLRFGQSRDLSFSHPLSFSQKHIEGRNIDCRKMEADVSSVRFPFHIEPVTAHSIV